ncbi:membrane fusion protein (multidrug efflux system) [Chitinophaga skermanii]|uniref:Membrane fusion protein (Multidrug efflux system) n=1 Tax=Chitinophaga skermanii TaxID=331697 RepID=A0A327QB01_9BACT|nr:efflux RND transporter periplasmic adaptor subunit [Chitinophaga skermanii]RAJ00383.1 membrane fusion protein (multidrug efflux system) [Chitinophaga skermanii]
MKKGTVSLFTHPMAAVLYVGMLTIILNSCANTNAGPAPMHDMPTLPVVQLNSTTANTYTEYSAALEGKVNVEIRPQVDGVLDKIFVDEGAAVKKGQPLFKINDRIYIEQLSNAKAALMAAKANMEKAEIEVSRLSPLVQNKVVSEVQLKSAQSAYEAAKATVASAESIVHNAQINLGYTYITAPVDGYVGRIPYKTGSLVGRGEINPLTLLSDVSEVYAYFSLSEKDFLTFKEETPGNTIPEKLKHLPKVSLLLADNSVYEQQGSIESVDGQFNKTMGAISFRATFANPQGILRSGATGKVRIPQQQANTIVVPQESTYELQDKVFVFVVGDSNKVASKPLTISGKSGNYYLVNDGVKNGDRIVFAGFERLQDGAKITPQSVSLDSLLKAKPMQ